MLRTVNVSQKRLEIQKRMKEIDKEIQELTPKLDSIHDSLSKNKSKQ